MKVENQNKYRQPDTVGVESSLKLKHLISLQKPNILAGQKNLQYPQVGEIEET